MPGAWANYDKWIKSANKGQDPYNFTHMWNKKVTNEQTKQNKTNHKLRDTDIQT